LDKNFLSEYLESKGEQIEDLSFQGKRESEEQSDINKIKNYQEFDVENQIENFSNKIRLEEEEFNERKDDDNFANLKKINKDYEKQYGQLYRIFDLRSLKNRVWNNLKHIKEETNKLKFNDKIALKKEKSLESEALNNINNNDIIMVENENSIIKDKFNNSIQDSITFSKLYKETIKNLNPDMKNSFNNSSLFVCLLHLANEKS